MNAVHSQDLKIVYGSSLAENRSVHFLCPPEVASMWYRVLPRLSTGIKSEDPRMVWLKDQYLFLYFQDDLCMGPLAADAIKVILMNGKLKVFFLAGRKLWVDKQHSIYS